MSTTITPFHSVLLHLLKKAFSMHKRRNNAFPLCVVVPFSRYNAFLLTFFSPRDLILIGIVHTPKNKHRKPLMEDILWFDVECWIYFTSGAEFLKIFSRVRSNVKSIELSVLVFFIWWRIFVITCQIIMLTCQIFLSSCQIFMLLKCVKYTKKSVKRKFYRKKCLCGPNTLSYSKCSTI